MVDIITTVAIVILILGCFIFGVGGLIIFFTTLNTMNKQLKKNPNMKFNFVEEKLEAQQESLEKYK